jgi:hypothetical protein
LGIVNGAQGFIRKFSTSICPAGYTYATSVIIEVPRSKVKLSNLPPIFFPLEPLTWNFTSFVHIDPEKPNGFSKCRVQHSQMSCQPGFATSTTGRSAQGKTLPKILCALYEGGFAACVQLRTNKDNNSSILGRKEYFDNLTADLNSGCENMSKNTPPKFFPREIGVGQNFGHSVGSSTGLGTPLAGS